MPLWVILVVVGVLVVAALILIVAVHILDVHAEQQCAHLHDLTQRSLHQNQDQAQYQYRCGESHLCCRCGSVRNRRSQVSNRSNSNSRGKSNPRLSTAGGLLQPLMDAACGKSSLSSGSLECLSGLTSRRKVVASGLQGGWLHPRTFFRGTGAPEETHAKLRVDGSQAPPSVVAAASATAGCSTSAAAFASASRTVGGSDSDSLKTITATITGTSNSSDPARSSTEGQTSSGVGASEGGGWKPIPQRRLVLEILMSPSSAEDGQGGHLPRATGVRLKLETNASLESLASLATTASSGAGGAFQLQETDAQSVLAAGLTSVSCGPLPPCEGTECNMSNFEGTDGASSRVSNLSIDEGSTQLGLGLLSTMAAGKCSLVSQEASTAVCMSSMASKFSVTGGENDSGVIRSEDSAGQAICSIPLDKGVVGIGIPSTVPPDSLTTVACKSRSNDHMVGVNSSSKTRAKTGSCSTNSDLCSVATLSGFATSICPSTMSSKGAHSQVSFGTPLDGLNSLRISFLDGGAKTKSMKDCSKGVTAEIASALAALNVDSIGGKGVGMVLTLGPGGGSDAAVGVGQPERLDVVQEEEVPGEGSGSEHVVEDGDERHVVPEAVEEDEGDVNKKEKRKKRNRGRRQKAKAAAVAAAAAGLVAQARHMNERHGIEAVETLNVAIESEVGCICGVPKGGCHSNSCPYPFTSSGSMVQRKIKEQYDELVRSNVAKTLTLAQVGRFTTCLVDAKSALQQKSDTIQRRFTIAKSLLSKADKSSFDRLCGQIYGLEIEQKKLEEDTVVYNRLQEQLKLSPAYQKMLEYGRTHFELQPKTGQLIEKMDSDELEISFEDLLAQEKKDSFWQKHGPSRSSTQVS